MGEAAAMKHRSTVVNADEALAITMRNLRRTAPSEATLKTIREIEAEVAKRSAKKRGRRRPGKKLSL